MPRAHHRCPLGAVVTRPRCGFDPNRPQHAAGIRIEPPPSPPIATGTMPAATATAEPPLEPPGERVASQGLRVSPCAVDSENGHWPNSGIAVLPTTIAPAARSLRTTSPSSATGVELPRPPNVVTWPATSSSSFTATGIPCNGGSSSWRARAASRASASARAWSAITTVNACRVRSSRSIRASSASTSSRAETSPSRTSRPCSTAPA